MSSTENEKNDVEVGIVEGVTSTDTTAGTKPTATTTTTTLELNTDMTAAQRFPIWIFLFASSVICAISLLARLDLSVNSGIEAWVLTVSFVSLVISCIGVIMYLFYRDIFINTITEKIMVVFLLVLWCVGLPFIMDPKNDLAVSLPNVVVNANLYFTTWSSFICTILLSASLLQDNRNITVTNVAGKTARWYGLIASSFVVLGASARVYRAASCSGSSSVFCSRTAFSVSLGAVSLIVSCIMTCIVSQPNSIAARDDLGINIFVFLIWSFGVGFITFGSSPGIAIGNLYFGAWTSFMISVYSCAVSLRELNASRTVPK